MATQLLFSVYDSKAGAYLAPFFCVSRGVAIRMFMEAAQDEKHMFSRYPEDFTLFHLGSFEDSHAQFSLLPTPEPIGKAVEFRTESRPFNGNGPVVQIPLGSAPVDMHGVVPGTFVRADKEVKDA